MAPARQNAALKIHAFRRVVWAYYRRNGRHTLPWRRTKDPYRILVSEIMLQQTQVERVLPYYRAFLKQFPTVHALRQAPLSSVLRAWQGLGYNRRAKLLHEAAKTIAQKSVFTVFKKTRFNLVNNNVRHPMSDRRVEELEKLPGVGPYTARALCAFAFNQDVLFVETNIRTAILHHFFKNRNSTIYSTVSDSALLKILEKVLPKGRSRMWYSALMDYGAHLKRSGVRVNARSAHYTKQSPFRGSAREARGAILKVLVESEKTGGFLSLFLGKSRSAQMRRQIDKLCAEGLIEKRARRFRLARFS